MTELMIQFQPGIFPDRMRETVEALGAVWKEEIAPQRVAVVRLPENAVAAEWIRRFRKTEGVAHVELNAEARPLGGDA